MIGRILSHLMGNVVSDADTEEGAYEELRELEELEEGEWVIVSLPEEGSLAVPDMDPLEQMLIEHPSMSVYQMRRALNEEEEEEEEPLGADEDASRPAAGPRLVSWSPGAWGVPLPCDVHLRSVQRTRTQAERKRLSRGALQRQNLARARLSWADRRYGHFKQPCQRLYNY